jgi:hypothetical protein
MTSDGFGEMFKGDFATAPTHFVHADGGKREWSSMLRRQTRNPIGMSGFKKNQIPFFHPIIIISHLLMITHLSPIVIFGLNPLNMTSYLNGLECYTITSVFKC